jgi:hypothetical protein
MFCPRKFNANTLNINGYAPQGGCECEGPDCAWWNEDFERCCITVDAYLKGREIGRQEALAEAKSERDRREL